MKQIKWVFSIVIFLLASNYSLGQSKELKDLGFETWKTLSKVKIEARFDDDIGFDIEFPVFSKEVIALDKKEITVSGYLIPMEEFGGSPNFFVFSSLPFNNCFFCGGAGPETVMEIHSSEKVNFTTNLIVMRGVLELNDKDPFRLMYVLKDAKTLK
jgi:hypothetical protein